MKRTPNLFLIGAPKCGTTTIYEWLDSHPEIFMAAVKEPHYFYSPYGKPMPTSQYEALFARAPQKAKYIGEASVWYLYSETAVSQILNNFPDSKFIVCLRNPNEAAPSAHAQKVFTGHEQIAKFDTAWDIREKRKAGSFDGTLGISDGDAAHMSYSHAYMLGTQVERLLKVAPKEQVFILLMDDLRDDSDATLRSLASFLDVTWKLAPQVTTANRATRRRLPIVHNFLLRSYLLKQRFFPNFSTGLLRKFNRINSVEKRYETPSDRVIAEMRQTFLAEIRKLEALTGHDLKHWY